MKRKFQKIDFLYVSLIAVTVLILLWIIISMLPKDKAPSNSLTEETEESVIEQPTGIILNPVYRYAPVSDIFTELLELYRKQAESGVIMNIDKECDYAGRIAERQSASKEEDLLTLDDLPVYPYEELMNYLSDQSDANHNKVPDWVEMHEKYPIEVAVVLQEYQGYVLIVYRTVDAYENEKYVYAIYNMSMGFRWLTSVDVSPPPIELFDGVGVGDSLQQLYDLYPDAFCSLYNCILDRFVCAVTSEGVSLWTFRQGGYDAGETAPWTMDPNDYVITRQYFIPHGARRDMVAEEELTDLKKENYLGLFMILLSMDSFILPEPAS